MYIIIYLRKQAMDAGYVEEVKLSLWAQCKDEVCLFKWNSSKFIWTEKKQIQGRQKAAVIVSFFSRWV